MNTLDAIAARRSIRRFKNDSVSEESIRTILTAATQAPSGKNRQPWQFYVVREDKRDEMIRLMRAGIEKKKTLAADPDNPEWNAGMKDITPGSSEWTAAIMETAPVTIFVFNPLGKPPWQERSWLDSIMDIVDSQSTGAAIQNMLLAAEDLGLGTLWICDVFYAYEELSNWLGESSQMIAAVSIGYPDESPAARPRKALDEVTRWV